MTQRLVIDTNVLVSGLLRADGYPGRIVDLLLRGSYRALYDDRLLAEYDRVLPRPRFGFDPKDIRVLLAFLRETGEHVLAPPLALRCSDPEDQAFLEVAVEAGADALVTGNRRHFPNKAPIRIVEPAELLRLG